MPVDRDVRYRTHANGTKLITLFVVSVPLQKCLAHNTDSLLLPAGEGAGRAWGLVTVS